jgi:hypothetical protein
MDVPRHLGHHETAKALPLVTEYSSVCTYLLTLLVKAPSQRLWTEITETIPS